MFRTAPAAEPPADVVAADDTIPLSHLELDIDAPGNGWAAHLAEKGINVVLDDVGRLCVARGDARQLFTERRQHEARAREIASANEAAAVERDRAWRASLPKGAACYDIPAGVLPASALLQAAKDSQPRRQSVLQHALSHEDGMMFHPLPSTPEGE
jgi:hypothetical protein